MIKDKLGEILCHGDIIQFEKPIEGHILAVVMSENREFQVTEMCISDGKVSVHFWNVVSRRNGGIGDLIERDPADLLLQDNFEILGNAFSLAR